MRSFRAIVHLPLMASICLASIGIVGGALADPHQGAPRSATELSANQPATKQRAFPSASNPGTLIAGAAPQELLLASFIDDVLARNRSVQAMIASWRAAAQRYPQVVSLEDPMFGFMVGPASWGSAQVDDGYMIEARQKLPWPGKRQLRGQEARAQTTAARFDIRDAQLQVVQAAKLAYFEYYLVRRQLELNSQNRRILGQLRDTARTRYEAGQVTQQDVLQAEVELADTERRQIELERMNRVARARINTLLLQPPYLELPPPASVLPEPFELPPAEVLHQIALESRPDLAALSARVRAEQAAVNVAQRDFYPDVEAVGRYDAFWQPNEDDLRPQVGLNMNVPVYRERRQAAVREASFRTSQRRAELQQRVTDVQFEVQSAFEQVEESRRAVALYENKFLPAAEQNVSAASTNYSSGSATLLTFIQAQSQLINLRERHQQAIADYHIRLAQLERVIGGLIPSDRGPEVVPTPPPHINRLHNPRRR